MIFQIVRSPGQRSGPLFYAVRYVASCGLDGVDVMAALTVPAPTG